MPTTICESGNLARTRSLPVSYVRFPHARVPLGLCVAARGRVLRPLGLLEDRAKRLHALVVRDSLSIALVSNYDGVGTPQMTLTR